MHELYLRLMPLEAYERALAVRRERAARHAGFIFVPWELTRSFNTVADLLLNDSPPRAHQAAALFKEAREATAETLAIAPSFSQVRRQRAVAEKGIIVASELMRDQESPLTPAASRPD